MEFHLFQEEESIRFSSGKWNSQIARARGVGYLGKGSGKDTCWSRMSKRTKTIEVTKIKKRERRDKRGD